LIARAAVAMLMLLMAACSAKPAPFPVPASELGGGPGLLSGPTGEFTIYRQ
jgi:hypothetical protein